MRKPSDKDGQPVRDRYPRQGVARQRRLAVELRTNLAKRKQQARARDNGEAKAPTEAEPDTDVTR